MEKVPSVHFVTASLDSVTVYRMPMDGDVMNARVDSGTSPTAGDVDVMGMLKGVIHKQVFALIAETSRVVIIVNGE